jgi:hypothetical protein
MKLYIKDNILKSINKITLIKDGMQIFNPTEEMILEDGWVEWGQPELIPQQAFESAKKDKINEILEYDSSSEVNEFFLGETSIWLDKATRAGLKLRFEAEIAMGKTETALWYNNEKYPLKLDVAMQMLYAIELYASACYDNTQLHLANVDALLTTEDISVYDYTTGYPEKLRF